MATVWPQQVKPRACRSPWRLATMRANAGRGINCNIWLKMLDTVIGVCSCSVEFVLAELHSTYQPAAPAFHPIVRLAYSGCHAGPSALAAPCNRRGSPD